MIGRIGDSPNDNFRDHSILLLTGQLLGRTKMMTPETLARQIIDKLLVATEWKIQNRDEFDRNAALGVAVLEFQLPAGPCD